MPCLSRPPGWEEECIIEDVVDVDYIENDNADLHKSDDVNAILNT